MPRIRKTALSILISSGRSVFKRSAVAVRAGKRVKRKRISDDADDLFRAFHHGLPGGKGRAGAGIGLLRYRQADLLECARHARHQRSGRHSQPRLQTPLHAKGKVMAESEKTASEKLVNSVVLTLIARFAIVVATAVVLPGALWMIQRGVGSIDEISKKI